LCGACGVGDVFCGFILDVHHGCGVASVCHGFGVVANIFCG